MSGWILAAAGVLFFCAGVAAFANYRPIEGAGLLALSVACFCWLMIAAGMR